MSCMEVATSVVDDPGSGSTGAAYTSSPCLHPLEPRNVDEAALYVVTKCHHVEIPSNIDTAGVKHLSDHSRNPSRATIESIAGRAHRVYGSDSHCKGPHKFETLWLPWPACFEQCVLEKEGECQF